MPTVRLNNGDIDADGSLTALHITTRDVSTETMNVTGQLTASGDVAANNILGNVHVNGTAYASDISADTFNVSNIYGLTYVEGDVQATTVQATTITGLTTVNGDLTADNLHIASGITALTVDCETLTSEQELRATEMHAMTANISDTLTVGGDLIVEGDDDRVLGDIITDVPEADQLSLNMRHNYWYRTGPSSAINILADTDSGRIKTCYIISSPANPLALSGVQWLWEPVELEDTSKTHVIALQQVGAGPVMANVAYSY